MRLPAGQDAAGRPVASGPVTGTTIADLGLRAKAASRVLATTSTTRKDRALLAAADGLVAATTRILDANAVDVARAEAQGVSATVVDRLRLTPARVEAMAGGLRQVAGLPDPVGEVLDGWVRPNGLRISRVRVPLGVVALRAAYEEAGLPADALVLVEDTSREAAVEFMRQRGAIDVLIPRGGPSLIQSILDNATVPYVIDGDGNCHVYVDESADLEMAARIVTNAKTQRPSVCNAAETLLVHKAVAEAFLGGIDDVLPGVELVADTATLGLLPDSVGATEATDEDWAQEFLDLKMAVKVVGSIDDAIDHIARFTSGHSEAIVTQSLAAADRFTREVDAAAVVVNASTRFVDGEEFGFGAEIGISTQKLHARGPMGLRELTTAKYVVRGEGQTRG